MHIAVPGFPPSAGEAQVNHSRRMWFVQASDCVAFRCSTNTRSARFGWSRRSRDRGGEPRPRALREKLPAYASPLLLYAQEIEPHTGWHLGSFPQAFSHQALINACVHLIREDERIAAG